MPRLQKPHKRIISERLSIGLIGLAVLVWTAWSAGTANAQNKDSNKKSAGVVTQETTTVGRTAMSPIDELIAWYEQAQHEILSLRAEAAQLRLQLKQVMRERDDLRLFINDHDQYGSDFTKYTVFKAQQAHDESIKKAAAAKTKREEKKRRLQELRNKRLAGHNNGANGTKAANPLTGRVQLLQQAGYTPIGDSVLVGQMGYVYKTDTQKEYRYSPYFYSWYLDEIEKVDYKHLTLSGSIIHAAETRQNISFAIAFYDANGGQIGQTTVRVDGARPGVPYPFTAEVAMAADYAFDTYTAWVLYEEPTDSGNAPTPNDPAGVPGGQGKSGAGAGGAGGGANGGTGTRDIQSTPTERKGAGEMNGG